VIKPLENHKQKERILKKFVLVALVVARLVTYEVNVPSWSRLKEKQVHPISQKEGELTLHGKKC